MGNIHNKQKSRKALVTWLWLFLCFSSLNTLGSVDAFQFNDEESLSNIDSQLLSDPRVEIDFDHTPFRLPAEPIPLPVEKDDKDERENIEEDEHLASSSFLNTLFRSLHTSRYSNQAVEQLAQARANRRQIFLFVLHCCWKDFPDLI